MSALDGTMRLSRDDDASTWEDDIKITFSR